MFEEKKEIIPDTKKDLDFSIKNDNDDPIYIKPIVFLEDEVEANTPLITNLNYLMLADSNMSFLNNASQDFFNNTESYILSNFSNIEVDNCCLTIYNNIYESTVLNISGFINMVCDKYKLDKKESLLEHTLNFFNINLSNLKERIFTTIRSYLFYANKYHKNYNDIINIYNKLPDNKNIFTNEFRSFILANSYAITNMIGTILTKSIHDAITRYCKFNITDETINAHKLLSSYKEHNPNSIREFTIIYIENIISNELYPEFIVNIIEPNVYNALENINYTYFHLFDDIINKYNPIEHFQNIKENDN